MTSIHKKELKQALKGLETNKKIKDIHINYLLQKIEDLNLTNKLIKSIK